MPLAHVPRARWVDHTVPGGGHAADDGGPDQHHHKRSTGAVKKTHHPFVARKQAGHTARGGGVDREQIPRHINHAFERARTRHVDAVVVAWAQVDGGECAVLEFGGQCGVATHQRGGGVVVAFGLEDLVSCRPGDGAELADGPVHRAHQIGQRQRAHTGLQGAGEKFVEAGVTGNVRVGRLGHVDLVLAHKPLDDGRGGAAPLCGCNPACELGQRLFGQKVLGPYGRAVRHRRHPGWQRETDSIGGRPVSLFCY